MAQKKLDGSAGGLHHTCASGVKTYPPPTPCRRAWSSLPLHMYGLHTSTMLQNHQKNIFKTRNLSPSATIREASGGIS